MTTRDIAARLCVIPRTVELHLTAVYRKLHIAGRPELAGALPDDGSQTGFRSPGRSLIERGFADRL